MATVSFANIDQAFDMTALLVSFTSGTVDSRTATQFSWISPLNHDVDFNGTGFTYNGSGVPTGGTATEFRLDLNNDSEATPELRITGLSLALAALAPVANGTLTAEQQNDRVWKAVLAGNDTISFGSAATNGSFAVKFAGDGRNVSSGETLTGGADTLSGDVGSGFMSGDVCNVLAGGTVNGGRDTLNASGSGDIAGDAYRVSGTLRGGIDKITAQAGSTLHFLLGDAYGVDAGGQVTGGNDTITIIGATSYVMGDAFYTSGSLVGGDDVINGSGDSNVLFGDIYQVGPGGSLEGGDDTIHGNGGDDSIYGDFSINGGGTITGGNDKLFGDAGNDYLYGNDGDDMLDGGADNDSLDGGAGVDAMAGGAGDDTYYIDNAGDIADESVAGSSGVDTVRTTISINLASDAAHLKGTIENIRLIGKADINAVGNGLANEIIGNLGNNTLNGGAGIDTMHGLAGNDTYYVDNAGDVIVEAAGQGTADKIAASKSYTIKADVEVERLVTTSSAGTSALALVGNEVGQFITGNNGANKIDGKLGADTLEGRGGNDSFVFSTALGAGNVDAIVDFKNESGNDDRFLLDDAFFAGIAGDPAKGGELLSGFFKDTKKGAIDANDHLIYVQSSGNLYYDGNGSDAGERVLFAKVTPDTVLTYHDFFVN